MSKSACPLLSALQGRGAAAYTGEPLSFLLIEVQSNRLWIRGATPLQDNGELHDPEVQALLRSAEAGERILAPDVTEEERREIENFDLRNYV